jgi:ferredoxin
VDEAFRPREGTERVFEADTLLVAVGLAPVDELLLEAKAFGMTARAAGDAREIAEASAAMFSGRIEGRRLAKDLGSGVDLPEAWGRTLEILKSRPGETRTVATDSRGSEVYPVIRCYQEIPCNPCVEACPKESILIPGEDIRGLPEWTGECTACGRCVAVCPGLAITLVDERKGGEGETARVTVPFELLPHAVAEGTRVTTVGMDGERVGEGTVAKVKKKKFQDRCLLVTLEVPWEHRLGVAGIRIRAGDGGVPPAEIPEPEDPVVCRCERVRKSEIVREIREGTRDVNQLKSVLRCAMGACGGKTCAPLIRGIFRELGVDPAEVTGPTRRPFVAEVPLGLFAGLKDEE